MIPTSTSIASPTAAARLRTLLLAVIVLLAVLAPPAPAEARRYDTAPQTDPIFLPTADPDPFYAQPAWTEAEDADEAPEPGVILDSRPIDFSPAPDQTLDDVNAWHVKFASRGEHGQPIAAVATVVAPLGDAASPTPLLAYQIPYNSVGAVCTPSHSFAGDNHHPLHGFYTPHLLAALERGWAVVIPDFLGPDMTFGTVRDGAHITLDSVRAASHFEELGLEGEATEVGLDGWSIGGWTSIWASILAPSYAPEIVLAGVSVQGPEVELEEVGRTVDGDPVFGPALFSSFIGNARANPQYVRADMFNDAGHAVIRAMRDGCNHQTTDGSPAPSGPISNYMTVEPFDSPESQEYFDSIALPQAGLVPAAPIYIAHSVADQIVPIETVAAAVDSWCAEGATVLFDTPLGEHMSSYTYGATVGQEFLAAAFEGTTATSPPTASWCGCPIRGTSGPIPAAGAAAGTTLDSAHSEDSTSTR